MSNQSISSVESSPSFKDSKAYQKLTQLAQQPYDLTAPQALSAERIAQYQATACGFKLLYATQRVDEKILQALYQLAEERQVYAKMAQLQQGAVMNFIQGYPSENRPALHTALRDLFDHQQTTPITQQVRQQVVGQIDKLRAFMVEIDAQKDITDLVVIGIGGSELGPKACYRALEYLNLPQRRLHYIGNIDPDVPAAILQQIDPRHTLVAVVSKSGTTLETASNEVFLREAWKQDGVDPARHFIAVTAEGSPMDNTDHYRAVFQMWDWVGGRYSSTSMVGGLPLAFTLGIDNFWEFLRGAHAMDQVALQSTPHNNLPLLAALFGVWNRNFLGHPTVALIPYADVLRDFGAHIQQLDMESNGKRINQAGQNLTFPSGPIIWGQPGTNAQHSFFQLLHQGTDKVPLEIIGFANSQRQRDAVIQGTSSQQKLQANFLAQAISLATGQPSDNPNKVFPGNTPSSVLLAEHLTPFQLGALLAFYEHKVVFQGFLWGINSFDQEGVQLGKRIADTLLSVIRGDHAVPYPAGEAFLATLTQW